MISLLGCKPTMIGWLGCKHTMIDWLGERADRARLHLAEPAAEQPAGGEQEARLRENRAPDTGQHLGLGSSLHFSTYHCDSNFYNNYLLK